ncbi:MAG: hypothetical protein CFE29_04020 [Bradyrhizobiaceae bacterium PARB1]|nr:MAG: hypothetical protein CFE29_04020 [Bradyrhizobiaceae bacterium PARB1]
MSGIAHVIGAGLAGLAAALRLSENDYAVHVHEATMQAGGRCRSYFDPKLEMEIDNGNHLILSGNVDVLAYARSIGSLDGLVGPDTARLPFVELGSGKRWTIDLGRGRLPTWIFDRRRRVPDTRIAEYLRLYPLVANREDRRVGDVVRCTGPLHDRLLHPFLLAALNVDPEEGSAKLAGSILRESIVAGGVACRPLVARPGLGRVLVDPAVATLKRRGAVISYGHALRACGFRDSRVAGLVFADGNVAVGRTDVVVMATPPWVVAPLIPDLRAPDEFRTIVSAHFKIAPTAGQSPVVGVIGGLVEWLVTYDDRLSVTVSNGDRLNGMPRDVLAAALWDEVRRICGIDAALPPWQIVRERRATFAAVPEQNSRRPGTRTAFGNLFLAGDWTDTGLPATIEGAVRSGHRAADMALGPPA